MNTHATKYKGDLSVARIATDLIHKRWFVLTPLFSEHLPFDLLIYKEIDGKLLYRRIQVKSTTLFTRKTTWKNNSNVVSKDTYNEKTIDYFATWIDHIGVAIYVPVSMLSKTKSIKIHVDLPNTPVSFYWYEDFLSLKKGLRSKRGTKDFGYKYDSMTESRIVSMENGTYPKRKQLNITVAKLQKLLWKYPLINLGKKFNCSDNTIKKKARKYNCILPPQGYFNSSDFTKKRIKKRYISSIMKALDNKINI